MKFNFCNAGVVASVVLVSVWGASAHAATLSLTPGGDITVEPNALTGTVDGVGFSVQGFSAEIFEDGSDATVFGPYPTGPGTLPGAANVFGINQNGLGGGLGLLAQPINGINPTRNDASPGSQFTNVGFDSKPNILNNQPALAKFDFALFTFGSAVDVSSIELDPFGNASGDFFAAFGNETPDFSRGFLDGIADLSVFNGRDDTAGGNLTTAVSFTDITTLLIGATPLLDSTFGRLTTNPSNRGSENFLIDSLEVSASDTVVVGGNGGNGGGTVAPVPLPAGGLLLLSGLGAIGAFKRRKKRAA